MSELIPDVRVRLLVAKWPEDAPRGSVTAFCRTHNVSRAWFYKVRAEAAVNGPWPAMKVGSTTPKTSPNAVDESMVRLVLDCRAELLAAGYDFGPLSVHAKLRRRGVTPPSRATLARIFSRAGVVTPEPRKKPRSAYRRFTYPAPNCCWQIDGTEWTLESGQVVVVFQLIDDHSRLILASLVASGETSAGAIRVVSTAIARHGIPQKFLSDNGVAFNPTRRGARGKLVGVLTAMGVTMITGKPGKPTTQGKIERIHQPLQRFLNKKPPAKTMPALQALVDEFDQYYNTEREHQSLDRMTPREAWDATEIATPPQPPTTGDDLTIRVSGPGDQFAQRTAWKTGVVQFKFTQYNVGIDRAGQVIHIVHSNTRTSFYDADGTEIASHPTPATGTAYIGRRPPKNKVSTNS